MRGRALRPDPVDFGKSGVRGRDAGVTSAQTDAPQVVVKASFGEAAVAGSNEGKSHLPVLGAFCKVAMQYDAFAFCVLYIVVAVTHVTAEAFLLSGVVGSKDG